jgi:hypothetical protein
MAHFPSRRETTRPQALSGQVITWRSAGGQLIDQIDDKTASLKPGAIRHDNFKRRLALILNALQKNAVKRGATGAPIPRSACLHKWRL